jgi:hypothetical protein
MQSWLLQVYLERAEKLKQLRQQLASDSQGGSHSMP